MIFFGLDENVTVESFLRVRRDIVWWKSVFPAALQLAWKLGFRRVYLVGCGFHMTAERQYAWRTDLDEAERNWSQNTYNNDINRLKALKPIFDAAGFEVISSTPDSKANGILRYEPLLDAVTIAAAKVRGDTTKLAHSSSLAKQAPHV